MRPHFLDEKKRKAFVMLDSKKYNRPANFNRGKSKKPIRPKGSLSLRNMDIFDSSPELLLVFLSL